MRACVRLTAAHEEPVLVVRGEFPADGGLDEVHELGKRDLALLLEVRGIAPHELMSVDILYGDTGLLKARLLVEGHCPGLHEHARRQFRACSHWSRTHPALHPRSPSHACGCSSRCCRCCTQHATTRAMGQLGTDTVPLSARCSVPTLALSDLHSIPHEPPSALPAPPGILPGAYPAAAQGSRSRADSRTSGRIFAGRCTQTSPLSSGVQSACVRRRLHLCLSSLSTLSHLVSKTVRARVPKKNLKVNHELSKTRTYVCRVCLDVYRGCVFAHK
jgi:hypothetical protein